jgi:nucleotide-binding universal stress UspA family protein
MTKPAIVCPVDFSEPSRAALRYGAAIAEHFGARLVVLAVDDPLLADAAAIVGLPSPAEGTGRELQRFVHDTVAVSPGAATTVDIQVRIGKPACKILQVAHATAADLIIMGSHGLSGISKRFFGSTTERVLRETTIPVLVVPNDARGIADLAAIGQRVRRVLVPVDLTAASAHQFAVAAGAAAGLGVPLILAHVLERTHVPAALRRAVAGTDNERRASVETALAHLADASAPATAVETLILTGDPSEEIVRLADARGAGLVVMGLHSSGLLGPRMGSVTYRVLCQTHALVLAVPPHTAPVASSCLTAVATTA